MKKEDLENDRLFGNDAGEEEDEAALQQIYVETDRLLRVRSDSAIYCVRSRKGVGKSALLRRGFVAAMEESEAAVWLSPTEITPKGDGRNFNSVVAETRNLLARAAVGALAQSLSFAGTGTAEQAIAIAEEDGFRSADIVSKVARTFGSISGATRSEMDRKGPKDVARLLQRMESDSCIVVYIDDLDRGWTPEPADADRLSATIAAIREIARENRHVRFRLALREDVWQLMERRDEQLDKFRQYTDLLYWSDHDLEMMLAKRIDYFFQSVRGISHNTSSALSLIRLVFEESCRWQDQTKQLEQVLTKLCRGRPRDMLQLSRGAARRAAREGASRIGEAQLLGEYRSEYSRVRCSDLEKEFRHECSQLPELLTAFSGTRRSWVLDFEEVIAAIKSISGRVNVRVFGKPANDREILAFLYRCGLMSAREEWAPGQYKHYDYDRYPDLADRGAALDETLDWEVHPAFRPYLQSLATGTYHRQHGRVRRRRR